MNKDSELDFYVTSRKSLGIAYCVTHLYALFFIEQIIIKLLW